MFVLDYFFKFYSYSSTVVDIDRLLICNADDTFVDDYQGRVADSAVDVVVAGSFAVDKQDRVADRIALPAAVDASPLVASPSVVAAVLDTVAAELHPVVVAPYTAGAAVFVLLCCSILSCSCIISC